jgi:hypothetical protein
VLNIFKIHIFSGVVNAEDELWKIKRKRLADFFIMDN